MPIHVSQICPIRSLLSETLFGGNQASKQTGVSFASLEVFFLGGSASAAALAASPRSRPLPPWRRPLSSAPSLPPPATSSSSPATAASHSIHPLFSQVREQGHFPRHFLPLSHSSVPFFHSPFLSPELEIHRLRSRRRRRRRRGDGRGRRRKEGRKEGSGGREGGAPTPVTKCRTARCVARGRCRG